MLIVLIVQIKVQVKGKELKLCNGGENIGGITFISLAL